MRRLLDLLSPIPFPGWFMRLAGRLNTRWLRLAGGRGPLSSNVLILTTRGRRSGQERSTALLYFERAGRVYVVASFAGEDRHPAWYLNLVADANVTEERHGKVTRCVAHVLDQDEAAALWPFLDDTYHGFGRYRQRTRREIPIVQLIPTPAATQP